MRVLDLFSGIGGFALGLESVGMQTVAFCESDGYARRVLRRHWPDVWLYEDVRTLSAKRLKADGITDIDLICGGFPCQDISCAGKGAGIEGSRSGLWSEYARLIREVRPRWVLAENVPALRSRGADKVLGDLEAAGYSAWPLVVGALHAGAPHQRQRAWIVAHTKDLRCKVNDRVQGINQQKGSDRPINGAKLRSLSLRSRSTLAHTSGTGRQAQRADRVGKVPSASTSSPQHRGWNSESRIRRVADGVPARVDRLRCLGNAVVPQVVAMIGQAILDAEHEQARVA
jgi:DNA (cytosine-5)-methyltransferase 1